MITKKALISGTSAFLTAFLFPVKSALAVCPVCTVAVGAGVGVSRWLGVDDTVSGVWIGGLIVSMIIWTLDWMTKRNMRFMFRKIIISAFYYGIVIFPLYWQGIIGHPSNTLFSIDKLILGIVAGTVFFIIAVRLHSWIKGRNEQKSYFPFQKVAIPLSFLSVASLAFFFVTKYIK